MWGLLHEETQRENRPPAGTDAGGRTHPKGPNGVITACYVTWESHPSLSASGFGRALMYATEKALHYCGNRED